MQHWATHRDLTRSFEPAVDKAWPTRAAEFTSDHAQHLTDQQLEVELGRAIDTDPLVVDLIAAELDRRDRVAARPVPRQRRTGLRDERP